MGGRGGSYFTPRDLEQLRADASSRLQRSRTDAEVNSLLQHELMTINDRDIDRVNHYLDQIETAIENDIDGLDHLAFGGSVAKHTYVDGLSDIDSLVVLRDESFSVRTPADVRAEFAEILRRRLPQGQIERIRVGTMAVTIDYRDGTEIQLLPAVQAGGVISISSSNGESWTQINPRAFARRLTEVNESQGGAVVPAIKLAKSVLANKLGTGAPSGYHVEALAVAAFGRYTGPRTPKAMLTRLVENASRDVLRPIRDTTGQSRHVDGYLGAADSPDRRRLSRSLQQLSNALSSQPVSEWHALFD